MNQVTNVILGILAVIAIVAVVEIAILTIEWLTEKFAVMRTGDKDEIGFTVKQALESGNFEIVQGVFNTNTETIVDVQRIKAKRLDTRLENLHTQPELVIYN